MAISTIGTHGLEDGAIVAADIASGAVTQAKLGTGVAGTGPAFSAYLSGNQTISNNTNTKLALNTERFDTNSCYDTTNYRFTPNVAGYYQVNANVDFAGTAGRQYYFFTQPFKNGSGVANSAGLLSQAMGTGGDSCAGFSTLVYMNGTTDYLELYVYQYDYTASGTVQTTAGYTSFSATLVRAA